MADRALVAVALAIEFVAAAPGNAAARVQEYQIVRLLTFKSDCQITKLEDRSSSTGPMRFFASCENASFYPDGVNVICDDRDDDRSCHVLTRSKTFDHLHLLDKN